MLLLGDAVAEFMTRVASGSTRMATRILANALKEDPGPLPEVVALLDAENPVLRACATQALADFGAHAPDALRLHVPALLSRVHDERPEAREAALLALAHVAPVAPGAVAKGIDDIAEAFRNARRPAVRERAALCLARLGTAAPEQAARVVPHLAGALEKNPRHKQARAILAAMSELTRGPMGPVERESMSRAVSPLRGHPDLQVRERAVQLWRALQAPLDA